MTGIELTIFFFLWRVEHRLTHAATFKFDSGSKFQESLPADLTFPDGGAQPCCWQLCFGFQVCVWQQARRRILTQALVGGVPVGPGPGSVLVKRVTSLAVVPHCMVLADTEQPPLLPLRALAGVAVALTPEGDRDGYEKEPLQTGYRSQRVKRCRFFFHFSGVNHALDIIKWAFGGGGSINCALTVKPICIVEYSNY